MSRRAQKCRSALLMPPPPPPVKLTPSLPAPQPTTSTSTQNTPERSLNKVAATKKSATAKKVSAPLLPPLFPQSSITQYKCASKYVIKNHMKILDQTRTVAEMDHARSRSPTKS